MISLKFLNSFVKINNAVQEREDIGAEGCDVLHGPIVGVEYGEEIVHPTGMDKRPRHYREEIYLCNSQNRLCIRVTYTYMK